MNATCLDPHELRHVLDESLPVSERDRVVSHLDQCSDCQSRLERLASGDKNLLKTARDSANATEPDHGSAYWRALENVSQSQAALDLAATVDGPAQRHSRPDFDFFDPPAQSGHIGTLERFHIEHLVGRGGMGMVFRAYDSALQRAVAIKVLDPQYSRDDVAQGRFCREARAAAGVTHENVVTIHHVEHCNERNLSYIVMQFVPGKSVQDRLDEGPPIGLREAVRIAAATAAGLEAAHARGLIHRDIKPGNILLEEPTGRVLLTDFGLARVNADVKLTQTGFVAGTPLYMSPEQARGEVVDVRTDLFSLGSVLYAMLTGGPPFAGTSPFVVLRNVTDRDPRPVQELNPAVPNSLAAIVDRLLEKNPSDRFASAREASIALLAELDRIPQELTTVVPRVINRPWRSWWRRRSGHILAGLIGGLGLLAITEVTKLTEWTVLGQRGTTPNEVIVERFVEGGSPITVEPATPALYELPTGDGAVWGVAFDPCGDLLATATEGGSVKLWDAQTGTVKGELDNSRHKSPIWDLEFNHDGTKLITASDDGAVRLWDVQTRREANYTFEHTSPVRSVVFSPDGKRLASGTRTGTITIWDATNGKPIRSWVGHDGGVVMAMSFHKDGQLLATAGSDKTVKIWDIEAGTPQATLHGHSGPVYAVAFDPQGGLLASAGWDRTIRVWNPNTTQQVRAIDAHKEDVWSLAFSPSGKHLVSGGQDRTAKCIDPQTGNVISVYRGPAGPVHGVAVSKDGRLLAAGSRDGTVRVWSIE